MARTRINKQMTRVFSGVHKTVYKWSGGRFGGKMGDGTVAILTTTGRKSGQQRTSPIVVVEVDGNWVGTASYSGHDVHPAWYLNLEAQPESSLTIGKEEHKVTARTAGPEERPQLWERLVAVYADYAEYAKVTDREIPVVVFAPRT